VSHRVAKIALYMGPKEVGGPNDQQLGAKLTRWAIDERRHRDRSMNGARVALVEIRVVRPGGGVRLLRLVRSAAPVALAVVAVTLGLKISH